MLQAVDKVALTTTRVRMAVDVVVLVVALLMVVLTLKMATPEKVVMQVMFKFI